MDDELAFETICRGMLLSARVNGFEVASSLDERPKALRSDVRPLLVPGENTVVVIARPTPLAEGEEDKRWIDLKLRRGAAGTPWDVGDIVAGIQVDPKIVALEPDQWTVVLRHHVQRDALSRFDFEKASPWSSAREPEALEIVERVRAALAKRDARAILALYEHRTTEVASATGRERTDVEAELLEPWLDVFSEGGGAIDDDAIVFEVGCRGRVAHLRGPDGGSPVRARSGAAITALSMSVAVLRNEVRIVR